MTTLAIACVLMAGWIRSRQWADQFYADCGTVGIAGVTSTDSVLILSLVRQISASMPQERSFLEWQVESNQLVRDVFYDRAAIQWRWYGIGTTFHENENGSTALIELVPYWFVVAPLTLLAGWLLLSKLRPTNPARSPN